MISVKVFFPLMFSEPWLPRQHGHNIRKKQDNCCCHLLTAASKNNLAGLCRHAHYLCFVYISSHSKDNASRQMPSTLVKRARAYLNCDADERSEQVFYFTREDEFKHSGKRLWFHRHQGRTCAPLDGGIPSRQSHLKSLCSESFSL